MSNSRSPSPVSRRVSFNVPRGVSRSPGRFRQRPVTPTRFDGNGSRGEYPQHQGYQAFRPRMSNNNRGQRQSPQMMGFQGQRPPVTCYRCGRNPHPHPNQCPAITRMCNYCPEKGTFPLCVELRLELRINNDMRRLPVLMLGRQSVVRICTIDDVM